MAGFEAATAANSAPMALSFNLSRGDPVDWLPPGAAENLRRLRQHAHDMHSLVPEFGQRHALATEKVQAEQRLKRITDHPSLAGFGLKPGDLRVVEAEKAVERLTADLERMTRLDDERSQTWRAASTVLSNVQTWLRDGRPPGCVLQDFGGPAPTLNKGESITDGIERLRRRTRDLKADAHKIASSPFPSTYCKQRVREQIEALARAINVSRLVEYDGPVEFPTQQLMVPVRNAEPGAVGFVEVPDTAALFAWLHKDALLKRLDAEIDSESDDKSALSHEARQKAEAVVLADLLAIEREECALVWQALSQRLPVFHRSDCAPQAILECELIAAPHTNGRGR